MAVQNTNYLLVPQQGVLSDVAYNYGMTSYSSLVYDEDAISGMVYNVLTTRIGDDPGDPLFGSNLPRYVFEPYTAVVEQSALMDVYSALRNNIPQFSMSLSNSYLIVSNTNRILGIVVGVVYAGRLFSVPINLAGV